MANKPCPPTTPRLISRPRAVLLAPPPCFQEAECHGQSTTSSPHDQSGQRRIHEELADAHLALRPALHMPSHPPPPLTKSCSFGPAATRRKPVFTGPQGNRLGRRRKYPRSPNSLCITRLCPVHVHESGSNRVPSFPPLTESRSWGRPQPGASPCSPVLNVTDSAGGGVPVFPAFSMHNQALARVCA